MRSTHNRQMSNSRQTQNHHLPVEGIPLDDYNTNTSQSMLTVPSQGNILEPYIKGEGAKKTSESTQKALGAKSHDLSVDVSQP